MKRGIESQRHTISLSNVDVPRFQISESVLNTFKAEAENLLSDGFLDETNDSDAIIGKMNDIASVIKAPRIFEFGLTSGFIEHLERKFQQEFVYRGFVIRRVTHTTDAVANDHGTTCWHIDPEDPLVTKAPLYLSDVDIENGPFEFLEKVNPALSFLKNGKRVKDAKDLRFLGKPKINTFTEKAGHGMLVQTGKYWHRGRPFRKSGRTAIFFAFNPKSPKIPSYCTPLFPRDMVDHISEDAKEAFPEKPKTNV